MSETRVIIGYSSCGIAAGATEVKEKFEEALKGSDVKVEKTGCVGMCYNEPLVEVVDDSGSYLYKNIKPAMVERIIKDHVEGEKPIANWLVKEKSTGQGEEEKPFINLQERLTLRNTGIIDPERIEDYLERGGYDALKKSINDMEPSQVIEEVMDSGLRGRGGAGFPTGMKWSFARKAEGEPKYLICNADEGDPGAFMDKNLLEGDPHSVIEGMAIAAYAIGASEGYIYARAEYPLAIKRVRIAIEQANKKGYLGDNILGSDFSFNIKLKEGAGAFVCGEETALIASIEGERGMPRIRPPFPAQSGLWGKPTNNNNVETYSNVPRIIKEGAKEFKKFGTEKATGTKVFSLAGKINRGGLVEVPMGTPLRKVIYDIGGGIPRGKKFKAVQLGGPSGGCIPEELLDTPVDYDSINATGAIMGSGGMVVMDQDTCMVEVARFFLSFTQKESCGKCTFCRLGTLRMLEILKRIVDGEGHPSDIDKLEELADLIKKSSLCGLGQTAPNPVLTTLKYFRDEYEAHINDKKCPAGVCKNLVTFEIDPDACKACGMCKKACPNEAIEGEPGVTHEIIQERCIKCGSCRDVCPFDAVRTG